MTDLLEWLPFFLQTADPAFPTGAYAHSHGFEESVALGLVTDEGSLRSFLLQFIIPSQRGLELPYLRFAFEAAGRGGMPELCALDREIDAWKLSAEARLASAQLGGRRLASLRAVSDRPLLADFAAEIAAGRASGNHLLIQALQAVTQNAPLDAVLALALYQALAAPCAAALKLIRIGQDACQRALRAAASQLQDAIAFSHTVERRSAGCFNPVLEIAACRHQFASERLFIS